MIPIGHLFRIRDQIDSDLFPPIRLENFFGINSYSDTDFGLTRTGADCSFVILLVNLSIYLIHTDESNCIIKRDTLIHKFIQLYIYICILCT